MDLDTCAVALAKMRKIIDEMRPIARDNGFLMEEAVLYEAFNTLDNQGVFAAIDNYTDFATPDDVIKTNIRSGLPERDPAEWGDYDAVADVRALRDMEEARYEPNENLQRAARRAADGIERR